MKEAPKFIIKFHYTAKRRFLWYWKVVNEEGTTVQYGNKDYCENFANWLNIIWENGYVNGRLDEFRDASHEISKYQ